MPQTCGVVSRADRGGPGIAWSPESVIAINLLLERDAGRGYAVVPANAGTHNHRPLLLRKVVDRHFFKTAAAAYGSLLRAQPRTRQGRRTYIRGGRHRLRHPATCLMRAISSSTALSTGTFS